MIINIIIITITSNIHISSYTADQSAVNEAVSLNQTQNSTAVFDIIIKTKYNLFRQVFIRILTRVASNPFKGNLLRFERTFPQLCSFLTIVN